MHFLEPAYILHYRPYRDTSLLIDFFTQEHGILSAVSRGVRSAKSPLKGLLQPFIPLLISFSWKRELAVLTQAEMENTNHFLRGKYLFSGFYLNELLIKLLQRHDPHPELFHYYREALTELSAQKSIEIPLRRFEKRLLIELGYGLNLNTDAVTHEKIMPEWFYQFLPQKGFTVDFQVNLPTTARFSGKTLMALAEENFDDTMLFSEMKQLLRSSLRDLLGDKILKSRDLFSIVNKS